MGWFFLIFIVVPIAEIAVFIQVGRHIGVLPTLLLIVANAVVGLALVRWQGFATLRRAQESLARGVLPARELMDGLLILAAGLLLLTPGLVTDAVGWLLLLPPTRAVIRATLLRRFAMRIQTAQPVQRARDMEITDRADEAPGGPGQDGPEP